MFNSKNKLYITIFSTVYILGLLLGGLFQNIFYYFIVNGIFSITSIWLIYFITQNKTNNKNEEKPTVIQPIEKENKKEEEIYIEPEEIFVGEFISEDVFKKMEEDRKTWYDKTNKKIEDSLSDLRKILKGEDIENGKK